jgi:hypothetical protein
VRPGRQVRRANRVLQDRPDHRDRLAHPVLRAQKVLLDHLALRPRKARFGLRAPTARRQLAEESVARTKCS